MIRLGGSVDQDLKIVRIWERGDDDQTISWIWGKALRSLSVRDFHLLLTSLDFYLCEAPFLLRAATQLGDSIYADLKYHKEHFHKKVTQIQERQN